MLKFFENLKEEVLKEDLVKTYEVIQIIEAEENAFDYVESILRFMEDNSKVDFGEPGPLVHFMERFYKRGYERLLLESFIRKPTEQTVWMLNRILNDKNLVNRQAYMEALKESANRVDLDDEVMQSIRHYIEYQESR